MSMKRIGRGVLRLAQELLYRVRFSRGGLVKTVPRVLVPLQKQLAHSANPVFSTSSRRTWFNFVRFAVRHVGRRPPILRPFTVFTFRKPTLRSNVHERNSLRPLLIPSSTENVLKRIKDLFNTTVRYNSHLFQRPVPDTLDAYEIGRNIGLGCNAAVYELREKSIEEMSLPSTAAGFNEDMSEDQRLKVYPLALKLMYNYRLDETRSDEHLWREMGEELVPLPESRVKLSGKMGRIRRLPRDHPNVIRMETAFVDRMPILEDARERYPEALPTAAFYDFIISEPRTLFIVMKRYRMTLYKYAAEFPRNYWTGRVLFGQLLEALVFLRDHTIAHRDIKSDNILLNFDHPDEVPHLVLSDFGCSLATGSWLVAHNSEDVDLGGNLSTRAPEIASSRPFPGCVVDFSKADAWAAGTIAYEVFTRTNPFYNRLKSSNYLESDVPDLPRRLTPAVKDVVKELLRRDPEQRLSVSVAANVVSLSLFRFGESVSENLEKCGLSFTSGRELRNTLSRSLLKLKESAEQALGDVMKLYAAETIFARRQPHVVSAAELQLRATFLSRVELRELQAAVEFFVRGDALTVPASPSPMSPALSPGRERPSLNSLSSAGSRPPVPVL